MINKTEEIVSSKGTIEERHSEKTRRFGKETSNGNSKRIGIGASESIKARGC